MRGEKNQKEKMKGKIGRKDEGRKEKMRGKIKRKDEKLRGKKSCYTLEKPQVQISLSSPSKAGKKLKW